MSEAKDIIKIILKYWKTLLKWLFRIHDQPEITVEDLYDHLNSDHPPLLIDIRDASDYNGTGYSKYGHIPNARSIPILMLESSLEDLDSFKEKAIVTMCPGGGLSLAAVDILTNAGFKDVKSLKGGTDAWNKKGYPTTMS